MSNKERRSGEDTIMYEAIADMVDAEFGITRGNVPDDLKEARQARITVVQDSSELRQQARNAYKANNPHHPRLSHQPEAMVREDLLGRIRRHNELTPGHAYHPPSRCQVREMTDFAADQIARRVGFTPDAASPSHRARLAECSSPPACPPVDRAGRG